MSQEAKAGYFGLGRHRQELAKSGRISYYSKRTFSLGILRSAIIRTYARDTAITSTFPSLTLFMAINDL